MSCLRLELPTCAVLYFSNPHLFLSCTAACKKSAVIARGCQLRLFNYLMHQLIHLPTNIYFLFIKKTILSRLSSVTSCCCSAAPLIIHQCHYFLIFGSLAVSVLHRKLSWTVGAKSALSRLNYHMSQFSSRFNSR